MMNKTNQETKLLAIAVTIAAVAAGLAVGQQTAEARINENPDGGGVSGGENYGSPPGGLGIHTDTNDDGSKTISQGTGFNAGTTVGGGGLHATCDADFENCDEVGSGQKGFQQK
jgi:hypothetical protein